MTRRRSRFWVVGFCTVLLTVCSDDPATPALPPPPPPEDTDTADRAALIALYNATNGTLWSEERNWNTPRSIRNWHGVVTNRDGFVTELVLSENDLSGTLPPELGDLAQLRRLVLDDNQLTGPIPPELGRLGQLTKLDLQRNSLNGTIPPELGKLAQLTKLDLQRNSLNGTIPAELGALSRLDSLLLHRNELSGPIPAALANLGSLRTLLLAWNQLSGSLPPELGNLGNLIYMTVSRNELTGTIPPELANLSAIQILSVSRNNLTGTIPSELGDLATLKELYLYDNELTGEVPVSLASLSGLETLWIHENQLAGPLPEEFGNVTALQQLRVADNPGLTGLLPRSMIAIEFLRRLSFGTTGLCAQIDDEFQEWLRTIPDVDGTDCDVGRVERLVLTSLHDLTGGSSWANRGAWGTDAPLGGWHGVATEDGRVVEVVLPANGLSGRLPAEIANLTELTVVDLTGNDLSGAVPSAVAGLQELTELRVGRNLGLEGALPFALRQLERVRVLLYDGTRLCASPSPDFQAWYTAIEQTAGAICDNPDQVTVSLPMVYLTQSVQTPSRRVRLVANRDALLRAFVTAEEPRGFFEPEVVAVFTGPAGGEVHRVVMTRDANRIPAEAEEGDLELSYNAVIPADIIVPGVEMVVEVDPEGTLPLTAESETRFPDAGSHSLNVVKVPPMQLTLVPVMEVAEPDTSVLEWVRGISADSPEVGLLKHAFPFAEFSVRRHSAHYTSLDLTTESGQHRLLNELNALRASDGGTGYYYGVGTGYYYGVAASVNGFVRGYGLLPGWVGMGQASPVTLAHEVGHNLSLRHAPCGDPNGVDQAFPYPEGSIGVWGYDFGNGSVVSPDQSEDIMTYCFSWPWLSDYNFEKVIDHRAQLAAAATSARLAASNPPSDMLVLWGGAMDGELWIEPVFSMRAAARLPEARGPYRIRGTASDGQPLFSLDFTPGEDEYGGKHFFFTVPIEVDWEDSLQRITLTGPEGLAYLDQADERRITVVTERGTGHIRAILRDWEGVPPSVLSDAVDLEVRTTRRLREAVRLRR